MKDLEKWGTDDHEVGLCSVADRGFSERVEAVDEWGPKDRTIEVRSAEGRGLKDWELEVGLGLCKAAAS